MKNSKDRTITLQPASVNGIDSGGEAVTLTLRRNPGWKEPDLASILGWKQHSDFNEDVALDAAFALSRYDEDHHLGNLTIEVCYRDSDREGASSQWCYTITASPNALPDAFQAATSMHRMMPEIGHIEAEARGSVLRLTVVG